MNLQIVLKIHLEFKPKRLKEYRIPELIKPEVQKQIDELERNKFIKRSYSPQASPIVCVLKKPDANGKKSG